MPTHLLRNIITSNMERYISLRDVNAMRSSIDTVLCGFYPMRTYRLLSLLSASVRLVIFTKNIFPVQRHATNDNLIKLLSLYVCFILTSFGKGLWRKYNEVYDSQERFDKNLLEWMYDMRITGKWYNCVYLT